MPGAPFGALGGLAIAKRRAEIIGQRFGQIGQGRSVARADKGLDRHARQQANVFGQLGLLGLGQGNFGAIVA